MFDIFSNLNYEALTPTVVKYAVNTVGALALLLVAWIISRVVRRLVGNNLQRAKFDPTLGKFISKSAGWLILLLSVLACLSMFGVETTSFAAVIGAAGLAIGLAFQGTLANFAAGIMLLVFRPFRVGDFINAGGEPGTVDEIGIFATTLDSPDNRRVIIPNSKVFGSVIENVTHHPRRRADVSVGVDYSADLDHTRDVLTKAAESVPDHLEDPVPAVVLTGLGASSVDWSVQVWARREDFGAVKQSTIRAVKMSLDEAGIGSPSRK